MKTSFKEIYNKFIIDEDDNENDKRCHTSENESKYSVSTYNPSFHPRTSKNK